jgi:integrase
MTAHLYIRIKMQDGSRPFCEPVYAANRKLKPGYAIVKGKPEHHQEGVYHLRYLRGSKRVWESVGADAQEALLRQHQRELILDGQKAGVQVVEPITTGRDLGASIDSYLAGVSVARSANTYVQYEYALRVFKQVCTKRTLEGITREDVLNLRDYFIGKGNSNYTTSHHLTNLRTFLTYYDQPWPLKKTDRMKPTKKVVSAYSREEIAAMLSVASEDEADLLWFLLGTGARKAEALNATWSDIDFAHGTFKVSEKAGWTPKDKEEGIIPIPMTLVERLKARKSNSKGNRIFPSEAANQDKDLLKRIKQIAYKAGLNCGECHHKPSMAYPHGRCCATAPICERYILHKFRKTFATWHSENRVPVRTIQRWLRHSSLETTLKYLAGSDDNTDAMRSRVDATFSAIAA